MGCRKDNHVRNMSRRPQGRHRAERLSRRRWSGERRSPGSLGPSGLAAGAVVATAAAFTVASAVTQDERAAVTDSGAQAPASARPTEAVEASPNAATDRRKPVTRGAPSTRTKPKRDGDPAWLRSCTASDQATSHPNGSLPAGELCGLPVGSSHALHPDAAEAWSRLDDRYRSEFGEGICVTDSYRSIEAQEQVFEAKPDLAADPGTSRHGWGIALDLCGGAESYSSATHAWLRRNGPDLGWDNPQWARSDGSKPEPWHWEFSAR
ncbi:D-alanyl-D-alanine carboxypeptidase family protein [Nocardioides sp. NPDC057767]|uniref:D-alanyl-D-alanine carboxypeptidase-like protein n=1 Tax=Nocardioides albertanoniae TaxID=1175486 RepID=A0A543A3Q3_9ACTN|nr:D-alanyl-D-alanine carboxypeptidase-like protein [Nocardioides albertanoniae]